MKVVAIIALSLLITALIVMGSFRTDWIFYPVTGIQEYKRSVLGLVIGPISERNIEECVRYELGPKSEGQSKVLISRCYLIFGCTVSESPNEVFRCAT